MLIADRIQCVSSERYRNGIDLLIKVKFSFLVWAPALLTELLNAFDCLPHESIIVKSNACRY